MQPVTDGPRPGPQAEPPALRSSCAPTGAVQVSSATARTPGKAMNCILSSPPALQKLSDTATPRRSYESVGATVSRQSEGRR